MMSRVRARLFFFETDHKFRFDDRKIEKNSHFLARHLNRKWRSENQKATFYTHNDSEQFGMSLAGIGLWEDLERLLNKNKLESKAPRLQAWA